MSNLWKDISEPSTFASSLIDIIVRMMLNTGKKNIWIISEAINPVSCSIRASTLVTMLPKAEFIVVIRLDPTELVGVVEYEERTVVCVEFTCPITELIDGCES